MHNKIGIDATFNLHGGSYGHLKGFLENFSRAYNKDNIILYINPNNIKILDKKILNQCNLKIIKISSYGNLFRILWGQCILPFIAKIDHVDILFCPGNISPILKTTKVKSQWIATIGPFCKDMYKGVKLSSKLSFFINKWIIIFSSFTSNVVIHQADYSRQLFIKKYNLNLSKQYLIECGKDDYFQPDLYKIDNINKISNISSNDLLYVSHIFPYKNIKMLIQVFIKFKNRNNTNAKLYIVGKVMDQKYFKLLKRLIDSYNFNDEVIFTGLSSKNELKYAYSICKLFTFPSLCESSGYSLIEAMSCGAPILASNKTAIPFTCSNAAEYFNSYDESEFLSKLETLFFDDKKLQELKKKSLDRADEMLNYEAATNNFLNIVEPIL
jgi:glycosyltransferase involved in cell wall biosynthesis